MQSKAIVKEIELTARLNRDQYQKLKEFLDKNFKKTGFFKRFMVRFIKDKVDVRNSKKLLWNAFANNQNWKFLEEHQIKSGGLNLYILIYQKI